MVQQAPVNVSIPMYIVSAWAGMFDDSGSPLMRQMAGFPTLQLCIEFIKTSKLDAYTITLAIEIERSKIPLQEPTKANRLFASQ
jgi:hypothetical protein